MHISIVFAVVVDLFPSRLTAEEIFNLVDLDRGGSIDLDELRELMDLLGMEVSAEETAEMVAEIDTTGSGEISFPDFVRVMSKKVTPEYTAEQVIRAFEKFRPKDCPENHISQDVSAGVGLEAGVMLVSLRAASWPRKCSHWILTVHALVFFFTTTAVATSTFCRPWSQFFHRMKAKFR